MATQTQLRRQTIRSRFAAKPAAPEEPVVEKPEPPVSPAAGDISNYEQEMEAYRHEQELWEQAKKLIFAGKAGAVRGDPELQGKVNWLLEHGWTSAEQQATLREEQAKAMPKIPEGYQGVSSAKFESGIGIEKIESPQRTFQEAIPPPKASLYFDVKPVSQPKPTVIEPAPSPVQRIKEKAGELSLKARRTYSEMFEKEPSMDKLTFRKAAAEVSSGFLIKAPEIAGQVPGMIIEKAAPGYKGIKTYSPKTEIPMKVTAGGEEYIERREFNVFTPTGIKKTGGFVGSTAPYIALSPEALGAAGFLIATAPKKSQITSEERIAGGFMSLPLAGKAVSKAVGIPYRFATKPIRIAEPPPAPRYYSMDVMQPITYKGEQIERGMFTLIKKTPRREAEMTTRLRKTFGLEPKYIERISRARTDLAMTPLPLVTKGGALKEPSFFITSRVGKGKAGYFTLFRISGKQEAITVGGKEASIGSLEAVKVGRMYPKTNTLALFPYGKRVTKAETLTISKALELPKDSEIEVLKTATGIRDITKPLSRAKRKAPYIEGLTFRAKPIDITPSESYILPKRLELKTKTSVKSATKTMGEVKMLAAKSFPKQRPISVKPVQAAADTQELAPIMVGGEGKAVSAFAGKGLALETDTSIMPIPALKTELTTSPALSVSEIQKAKQDVSEMYKLKSKQITMLKSEPAMKLKQPVLEKEKQKEALETVQVQKIKQLLKTTTIPRTELVNVIKTGPTTRPVSVPFKVPISSPKKPTRTQFLETVKGLKSAYEVQVRRKGKFKAVSKELLPLGKALKLGSAKVGTTLAATFRLVPKGKTAAEDISFMPSRELFGKPKQAPEYPLTFIELRGKRLKKGSGEIPEIQYFKRRSGTKSKRKPRF